MVAIRLNRQGTKDRPYYKIVAVDNRKRRDGRFIEQVGAALNHIRCHQPVGAALPRQAGRGTFQPLEIGDGKNDSGFQGLETDHVVFPRRHAVAIEILHFDLRQGQRTGGRNAVLIEPIDGSEPTIISGATWAAWAPSG